MKFLSRLSIVVVALGSLTPAMSGATPVTLDFNELDPDAMGCTPVNNQLNIAVFCTGDYVEDGFRIQVINGHYDYQQPLPDGVIGYSDGTPWIGFDASGAPGGESHLRLDFFGKPFDILALEVVSAVGWQSITSSNGGNIGGGATTLIPGLPWSSGILDFSGPEWRNITFVDFFTSGGIPEGFDNIRVSALPEPSTLMLFCFGLFGLALSRRRIT